MKYYPLGQTGLNVSELCFGALPMGPLQANVLVEDGGPLILAALERGVNFIDTAEVYQTFPHIRWALEHFNGNVVLATKATGATYDEMKASIEKSLHALNRDRIEIFHLHAARDSAPLSNRAGAMEAILEYKAKGIIQAVGVACHSVKGITQAALDPRVDVVFPLINRVGMGILDGGIPEMIAAIQLAKQNHKGIYAMKALAGGQLIQDVPKSIEYVQQTAGVPVIAMGMIRPIELEMNLAIFEGKPVSESMLAESNYRKTAKVTFLCKGCGHCLKLCHNDAIAIKDGVAVIDSQKCLLCGYCSRECPQFAIRII